MFGNPSCLFHIHPALPEDHVVDLRAAQEASGLCVVLVVQLINCFNFFCGLSSEMSSKQVMLSASWLQSS